MRQGRPTADRRLPRWSVLVLLVLALVRVPGAAAQDVFGEAGRDVTKRGTTAAEFLNIPIGARATAMGNALSASVNDATSIYWNPAGLARMTGASFTVDVAQWLAGIDFNYAAVVLGVGGGTIGFGVTSMRVPEMEVTTVEQQLGTGETFDASSYAFSLSYGRALTDRFSLGATGKLVSERIWNSGSSGFTFDIGTLFVTPFRGIRLGASITNFGSKMQIDGEDLRVVVDIDPNNGGNNESNRARLETGTFDMPLAMRIGLAGEAYQGENARFTIAIDALSPNNSDQYVNVGAELALLGELLCLRGGYSELFLNDSPRTFTAGAGLNYGFGSLNFVLDYAYEGFQYFDGVNRLTLAVGF